MARKKRITKKVLLIKTVEIMQPILQLSDWKIVIKFSKSPRMKGTATCEALPEYKVAVIKINTAEIRGLSHSEIVTVVIHEMMHCILWDLGSWAERLSKKDEHKLEITRRYEESAITSLEKIILGLVTERLNREIRGMGYYDIDLTFTDFDIQHDR